MAEKVGEIYYDVTLELDQMIKDQRRAQQQLDKTASSLEGFQAKLTQVASAVAALASASYLIAQMDAYTKLSAQLKLATDSTSEFNTAMSQVKQIAQEAQTDISGVAVLYARITSATKEMGTSQAQMAAVTRAVALSLKVSGAGANEAASATLQLSQAFATGTLRGEEFNAVNEASPRLMKALADGIGVPVGQLREMAAAGKLTSEVMANALPRALKDLEQEAKSVQTIGGAFQQLHNEATLFIGEQASANGVVKALTGGIGLLANNLTLLAGIMGTVAAVKMATWMLDFAKQAIAAVSANRAMAASSLATAQANVAATAATVSLTTARVAELRQAVLSAEGAAILAVATNGLIPAQAAAKTAADAHTVALLELSVAQKAVSVSSGLARGAMSLLGGPIGLITTLLGLGVTAWSLWGNSARDESAKAAAEVEASGREIIASLEKQNKKLRERLALAKAGNVEAAKTGGKNEERLGTLLTEINALKAKGASLTAMEQLRLIDIQGEYDDINRALKTNRDLQEEVNEAGQRAKLPEWMKKYATDVEKANAEVAKAKKELGEAFTPELEKRIRDAFITEKKTPKPTKSPSEKFDGAGYLAGLEAATATAWGKIDAVEAESKRKNDVLLAEKKISVETHEKALALIRQRAALERDAINAAELQKEIDKIQGVSTAYADMERQSRELGNSLKESVQTPLERMNAELAKFRSLLASEDIDRTTFDRLVKKAEKEYQNSLNQMDQFTVRFAQNVQDQLGDTLYNSLTGNFKDIGTAWGQMLLKMGSQAVAANLARSLFGGAVEGGTGSGMFGSAMSAVGSFLGISGGRANGGSVGAGKMYEVNEKDDPELLTVGNKQLLMMAGQSGSVTPLGGMDVAKVPSPEGRGGSWAAPIVNVNILGAPSQPERVSQRSSSPGRIDVDVIFKEFEDRIGDGIARGAGTPYRALKGRFGLRDS
ncbi:tape measure protein [Comamonas testosteroni]|uniref:tape measure protein n=1 Tax=Comamonas testosteroni TaxID=285 RepID=UPI0005B42ECE|nr:tape measure protein [Comamonas testosteroni]